MRASLVLDRRSPVPLHRQIYEEWRRGILAGRFAPAERMPSTRELSAALGVSRATVTTAYDQLIAEGYLEGQHGAGTFVCQELPERVPLRPRAADAGVPPAAIRLSRFVRRLGPVTSRPPASPGVLDLSTRGPDVDLFPFAIWSRLVRRHLRGLGPAIVRDTRPGPGPAPLRDAIAAYLRRARAVRCGADQVIVVTGSQQALDLCARVLVDPGDEIVVEEPGYAGARALFAALGARLRAVPVDEDGIVVPAMPAARLACVTPSHQFPLGAALSLARRLELLAWARARQAFIIEDDYDSEFRYAGSPLPALQGLGDPSRVLYVGTFSNAMFPALRVGYVVVPPPLVEPFVRARWYADRHTGSIEQAALADFIAEGHFERHVRRMRRVYKSRREALLDALDRAFGNRVTVLGDAAGLHLVARFAVPDLPERARRAGVQLVGTDGYYTGAPPAGEYVIRFASLAEKAIREAIRRLDSKK